MKPNLSPVSFWKSLLPAGHWRGNTLEINMNKHFRQQQQQQQQQQQILSDASLT